MDVGGESVGDVSKEYESATYLRTLRRPEYLRMCLAFGSEVSNVKQNLQQLGSIYELSKT
jgi:hypothetical protein